MNKRSRRGIAAFQRVQQRSARFCMSQYDAHTQAIREHKKRGYADGLTRVAGLLDQRNRIS